MLEPDGRIERRLHDAGFGLVAGVDETGRGALAGPLVACAVILSEQAELPGLRDSKLLTPLARARLCVQIKEQALAISIVRVPPTSIDRRGLHRSNLRALREAAMRLRPAPEYLLVDGYPIRRVPFPCLSIKKGDRVSIAVAAASVVAKVTRDRLMVNLNRRHPGYAWDENKGYGTREHWRALDKLGPSPHHRLSFYGVGQMRLWSSGDDEFLHDQVEAEA
ncbi:MAG TPA: ribonuclease HII [Actinomycetota bacterium]|nr:ribonuclease HII [Actinomycetota bacterium]